MCLISSWLGFICLLDYKVPYLKKFRNNNGDVVTILGDLHKGQVRTKVAEAKRIKVPSNNEVREIIANHCNGSPKLQNLLELLAEIVILQK
jgi:hypothetical protein